MKIHTKIISTLMLLIATFAFLACTVKDPPLPSPETYLVAFSSQFPNTKDDTEFGNPASVTITAPATTVGTLYPTDPKITGSGYKFGGWYTGQNCIGKKFEDDTSVKVSEDNKLVDQYNKLVVYACWYKYKVTFYSDSTTVYDKPRMVTTPTLGALPTVPAKSGNTFVGWNTKLDGSGTEFLANTPLDVPPISVLLNADADKNLNVYAQWEDSDTVYAVTYNSNGGNAVGKQYVISPAATTVVNLPLPPTKLFNTFNGWFTAVSGGTSFNGGTDVTAIADTTTKLLTVYAQWTPTPGKTVTFNSYGGSSVEPKHVILPATTVGTLPIPSKPCYTFVAWYTEPEYSTEFTAGTTVTDNITVYAKWTLAPYTPTATYEIGDTGPSCVGKVFYIEGGGASGSSGLEMAPADWYLSEDNLSVEDPLVAWISGDPETIEGEPYQKTQQTLNGKTSTAIGTGSANTLAIIAQADAAYPNVPPIKFAAQLCREYQGGGKIDWFLPSKDELAQVYAKRNEKRSGGFADYWYWSSSEYGPFDAWSQSFTNGTQPPGSSKGVERRVRPVRKFICTGTACT